MTALAASFPHALSITASLLTAMALRADDWPQWRGPNRDGVWAETGIVDPLPAGGLPLCWRAPAGPGWSSPVVAQGRVYLTDAALMRPTARERVRCFEAASGKLVWGHSYDVSYPEWAFTQGPGRGPTATPIVQGAKLYTLGLRGDLICFDARQGDVLWKKNLEKDYHIRDFSTNASPLIEGNLLVLFIGIFNAKTAACVVALDRSTGKEVWKALEGTVTSSSPLVITAGGKRQLIVVTAEAVTSLDPATGKTYWQERTTSDGVTTPVFSRDRLLIGGLMMKLDPEKPAAKVLWPQSKAAARRVLSNTSTPLVQGDYVFSARSSGEFVCLEAGSGKQVWQTDKVTDLKSGASIHVTAHGDSAFLYTDRGELIRARLTGTGHEEFDRCRLLEPTYPFGGRNVAWPPPAYAGRRVFARNDKELVCFSLARPPAAKSAYAKTQHKPIRARLYSAFQEPNKASTSGEPDRPKWKSLFDGKTLDGWKSAELSRDGRVSVKDGAVILTKGNLMTGITYTRGDFPTMDYEVSLEGKKLEGDDFFCTTTFPVGRSFCSLVVGGWGGTTVGLSSIDSMDASENETSTSKEFKKGQWYRVRIRVTRDRIRAWIDDEQLVDLETTGRRIGIRLECGPCKPFGIATWDTSGAVRNIRVRALTEAEKKAGPGK